MANKQRDRQTNATDYILPPFGGRVTQSLGRNSMHQGNPKFKPSIRTEKKSALANFECAMVVCIRRAGLSISENVLSTEICQHL